LKGKVGTKEQRERNTKEKKNKDRGEKKRQ
jgi:hypothetical protein